MNVLELYSGIGGMHYAFTGSGRPGKVVSAIEINTLANEVYSHNFPEIKVLRRNIQALTLEELDRLDFNTILMSPPCQPFTRVGLKKDVLDHRTCSFLHIIDLLPNLNKLKYILVENVKGFENSKTRDILVQTLEKSQFVWQEFILSPSQFGIPNTRHRYYLIAKRKPLSFCFEPSDLMECLPSTNYERESTNENYDTYPIKHILESEVGEEYLQSFLLPDKVLGKTARVMDIVTPDSTRSCCFTKAYTHYADGTGSVLCSATSEAISGAFEGIKALEVGSKHQLDSLRGLKLRYFTPREVARLMCFPDGQFNFPEHSNLTRKQKYRLLGNSINVFVVSQLVTILTEGDF